jgi:hypothetical protein
VDLASLLVPSTSAVAAAEMPLEGIRRLKSVSVPVFEDTSPGPSSAGDGGSVPEKTARGNYLVPMLLDPG